MQAVVPIALVVDDMNEYRETRTEVLEAHKFAAIGAASKVEALRELRASPSIDLAVIDISLDPKNHKDMSGVDLAAEIHAIRPELPIVGYSGRIGEDDVRKEHLRDFVDLQQRGSPLRPKDVQRWYGLALEHRRLRVERAQTQLDRLCKKYDIVRHDFNLLREFVPGAIPLPDPDAASSPEDILRAAGYSLRIVEKDEERPTIDNEQRRTLHSISVWLHSGKGGASAEVYGFPELYACADKDDDAIRSLLLLMDGYYQDLRSSKDASLEARLCEMRDFLVRVFG